MSLVGGLALELSRLMIVGGRSFPGVGGGGVRLMCFLERRLLLSFGVCLGLGGGGGGTAIDKLYRRFGGWFTP